MRPRASTVPPPGARIYRRGNRRLDALLDLLSFSARPRALLQLLDEGPKRIAEIFGAAVCSVYLLEGDGSTLVMRGNVGFGASALGEVRLRVGEGITGQAVAVMRPISADTARRHASYKHFAQLGEDRFPAFLAVPIRGKSGALGALVVQRAEPAFTDSDVELLSCLGALIGSWIRADELLDAKRERKGTQNVGSGTRRVTLAGRTAVPGRALGPIAALERPAGHGTDRTVPDALDAEAKRLRHAVDVAHKSIRALIGRAERARALSEASFLHTYDQMLADGRFRERAMELVAEGATVSAALAQVAREATRNASALTRDAFLEDRARDLEDLCDAITALAGERIGGGLPSKAVLVGDGLTVFDLLVSSRTDPAALVLSERATAPRTAVLTTLLGIPSVVDVHGLFRWAADGDIALVDADHGLLVINPSKAEIRALREERREERRRSLAPPPPEQESP